MQQAGFQENAAIYPYQNEELHMVIVKMTIMLVSCDKEQNHKFEHLELLRMLILGSITS